MIYLLTVNYNCAELIKRLIASLDDDLSATLIIVNNSIEDKNIQSLKLPSLVQKFTNRMVKSGLVGENLMPKSAQLT